MCGRYALNISGEDLALEFAAGIKDAAFTPSNWNISPTTAVPFINADDEKSEIRNVNTASWGLIPSWAKDASRASNAINARVESISEKPTFKSAFKSRRCLIPVMGHIGLTPQSVNVFGGYKVQGRGEQAESCLYPGHQFFQ